MTYSIVYRESHGGDIVSPLYHSTIYKDGMSFGFSLTLSNHKITPMVPDAGDYRRDTSGTPKMGISEVPICSNVLIRRNHFNMIQILV